MKIEEKVPTRIPKNRTSAKGRITSPPIVRDRMVTGDSGTAVGTGNAA